MAPKSLISAGPQSTGGWPSWLRSEPARLSWPELSDRPWQQFLPRQPNVLCCTPLNTPSCVCLAGLFSASFYTQKVMVGVLKPPGAMLHAPDAACCDRVHVCALRCECL